MGMNASKSESESQQSSESFVWDQQAPFLQNLWSSASDLAMGMGNPFQGAMGQVQPWMNQAAETLGGLADPSQQIATQEASLSAGLSNLFNNEINPAITGNSVAAGGLGGGRQGVAQGVAQGQIANAYTQGLGDITARANQQAGTAAQSLGTLGNMMFGMQGQAGMGALAPLQALSQLLGRPTVLQKSQGESASESGSFGFSFPGFGG